MVHSFLARVCQIAEMLRASGRGRALRECLYWSGELVPVERDLSSVASPDAALAKLGATLVWLGPGDAAARRLRYPVQSRRYKAFKYFGRGCRAFALVRDNEVLGDVWHAPVGATQAQLAHRDFDALGLDPGPKDVYMFDMFVDPRHRGEALAATLLGGALHALGQQGCARGYGFFRADNIPALWVHRLLRYKELPRVRVRRVLCMTRVLPPRPKGSPAA
jgi:GNAT superfamily N-acetyltransferase